MIIDGCLPKDHHKRKVVIVLDKKSMNEIKFIENNELRVNPNICLVLYEDCLKDKMLSNLAKPDAVLIQNPYDTNKYDYVENSLYSYSIDKHTIVSRLFQKLGCKELEITQVDVLDEKKTREIEINAGCPVASVEFESLSIDEKSLCNMVSLMEKYEGCEPQIEYAENLLKEKGLDNDSILGSIIEKRKDCKNKLKEHTLKITLNNEVKNSLELIANINIPIKQSKAESIIKITEETKKEYRVTYRALF